MQNNESDAVEGIALTTDPEPRDVRAVTEYMTVLPNGPRVEDADDLYCVVSQSGGEYTVDARTGACDCPDATHNLDDELCKHARRVAIIRGERPFPAVPVADVDDQIGIHVRGGLTLATLTGSDTPRRLVADGGRVEPREPLTPGERPPECDCSPYAEELPCFPCYRAGFRSPADVTAENDD
ncbi:hypothetical protein [Halopelagius fulvigenes]|uniref:SWIM-type domain-containing protein n=1 Tax=Halopelagius fulvigenes TaxID=1198324 RepID=A0ABD5TSK1_9EURY